MQTRTAKLDAGMDDVGEGDEATTAIRRPARTRMERPGTTIERRYDAETDEMYDAVILSNGRQLDKNRSDSARGYKSHLTEQQLQVIRWALRQIDRGVPQRKVFEAIRDRGVWKPQPGQYPMSRRTIHSWLATRAASKSRGKEWPPATKK